MQILFTPPNTNFFFLKTSLILLGTKLLSWIGSGIDHFRVCTMLLFERLSANLWTWECFSISCILHFHEERFALELRPHVHISILAWVRKIWSRLWFSLPSTRMWWKRNFSKTLSRVENAGYSFIFVCTNENGDLKIRWCHTSYTIITCAP